MMLGGSKHDVIRLVERFREETAPRDLQEGLQVDLAIVALGLLRRAVVRRGRRSLGNV